MCIWAEPIKTNLVGGTLRNNALTFDFLYGVRKKKRNHHVSTACGMWHKHTQTGVHTLCTDKKEVIKGRRFIRLIFLQAARQECSRAVDKYTERCEQVNDALTYGKVTCLPVTFRYFLYAKIFTTRFWIHPIINNYEIFTFISLYSNIF